jgi:glc operon protein GlcG
LVKSHDAPAGIKHPARLYFQKRWDMTRKSRTAIILAACAMTALGAGAAMAAQAIDKFVVTGDDAKVAKTHTEVSLDTARKITDVCLKFAADHKVRVSVFILNPGGSVVFAARMDGQQPVNIDTGLMKAKGALYMRDSTHNWANVVIKNPAFATSMQEIGVFTTSGGLPIVVDDQIIGSIGVGGSNIDEECAQAGLEAVLGPQPPLAPRLLPNGQPAPPPANLQ